MQCSPDAGVPGRVGLSASACCGGSERGLVFIFWGCERLELGVPTGCSCHPRAYIWYGIIVWQRCLGMSVSLARIAAQDQERSQCTSSSQAPAENVTALIASVCSGSLLGSGGLMERKMRRARKSTNLGSWLWGSVRGPDPQLLLLLPLLLLALCQHLREALLGACWRTPNTCQHQISGQLPGFQQIHRVTGPHAFSQKSIPPSQPLPHTNEAHSQQSCSHNTNTA